MSWWRFILTRHFWGDGGGLVLSFAVFIGLTPVVPWILYFDGPHVFWPIWGSFGAIALIWWVLFV